jgi:hypothetical protein
MPVNSEHNAERRFSRQDAEALRGAVAILEYSGLTARIADFVGAPIEKVLAALPKSANGLIVAATEGALRKTLDIALLTIKNGPHAASQRLHKMMAAISGAAGGAAGLAGLTIELPVTTTIMFRSIADIARAEGEDIRNPATCLACMEVFALGGKLDRDDAAETTYFATRLAMSHAVREASKYMSRGALSIEAPLLIKLIMEISSRFGIVVTWKAAAQILPVVGAIGGAAINTLFIDHFQSMAMGHFTVRRLERKYGTPMIRDAYETLQAGNVIILEDGECINAGPIEVVEESDSEAES